MFDCGAITTVVLVDDGAHGLQAEIRLFDDSPQRPPSLMQLADLLCLRLAGTERATGVAPDDRVVEQRDVPIW